VRVVDAEDMILCWGIKKTIESNFELPKKWGNPLMSNLVLGWRISSFFFLFLKLILEFHK